jgi:CheY-like chemotaxis protein
MAGERKRRILVVEDEALIAMDLERIVRRAGCEVLGPVGRAEEALRLAAEERLDAAILDIELSDGDSFAVADALARRRVPFVFVTGSAPAALPERFRGRPLIRKPYNAAKLAAMLGGKAAAARGRGGRAS